MNTEHKHAEIETDSGSSRVPQKKFIPVSGRDDSSWMSPDLSKRSGLDRTRTTDSKNDIFRTSVLGCSGLEKLMLLETLSRQAEKRIQAPLALHSIEAKQRAKMVDWMIEVLQSYQQKDETLFRAVHLLDLYLAMSPAPVSSNRLHLLGSVAMMLASKHQEVNPILLESFRKTICKEHFSKEEIISAEIEFLQVIGYRLHFPTSCELSKLCFCLLSIPDPELMAFIERSAMVIVKMTLFCTEITTLLSPKDIAAYATVIALKLAEGLRPGLESQSNVS